MVNRNKVETKPAEVPGMFTKYRPSIMRGLRQNLASDHLQVYDMLRYYMGWADVDGNPCVATEGKALRPTLCLFACEAAGGTVGMAMPAAVALELIHNFSLIHDDIQDGDETRHHRPTVGRARASRRRKGIRRIVQRTTVPRHRLARSIFASRCLLGSGPR